MKKVVITLEVDERVDSANSFLTNQEVKEWAEVQVNNPEMYGMDDYSQEMAR